MSDEKDYYELVNANGVRKIPLQDVVHLITVAKMGAVELADKLGTSRPTERKIRKRAMEWAGLPTRISAGKPGRPPADGTGEGPKVSQGDYTKARQAARMLAEGATEQAVMKKLGVGYRRGKRLIGMASQAGVVAMVASPQLMQATIQASLDVMQEITQANENIKDLSEWMTAKINELQDDTSHDADYIPLPGGKDDEDQREIVSVKPYHERQKNMIHAVDVLRKLQETHFKAVKTQQEVLQDLFDLKRINEAMADIHEGIRDGLIALSVAGQLRIPVDEAVQQIAGAIRRRFAVRRGITG